jgi:hypothetical protein
MKYFYRFLFLILLTPAFSFAQSYFKPGYVVSLNGDTIHGFIDYKEWTQNPHEFNFKKNIDDSRKETYTRRNCSAFAVTGFEYYRRFIVSISQDKDDVSILSVGIDSSAITDTVFLKIVTTGKKLTLYTYYDGLKARYFVSDNNNTPVELIRHLYLDPQEDSKIITQKTYTLQLQQLAFKYQNGNNELINAIANCKFSSSDLGKIINKINGDSYQQIIVQKRAGFRLFAGIGLNNTSTKFTGQNEFTGIKPVSTFFPELNIGADFFSNKNVGKLIIRFELSLTGNKAAYGTSSPGIQVPYASTLRFNQYLGSFSPQLVYNLYNGKTTKIYIAGGINFNLATYSNKYYVHNFEAGAGSSTAVIDFPGVQSFYYGFTTKAGFVLNKNLNIYFSYNPATSINDNVGYSIEETQYAAGINYLFGIK